MINSTTHNANRTTTVGFDRPIGGIPATLTISAAGTGYTSAAGVTTALVTGTAGGSGLTVNTTDTLGLITGVAIAVAGNHYSVGDIVSVAGGGGDARLTVATLTAVPQGTAWTIHSGKTKRSAVGGEAGNGFTANMNLQQWLIMPFYRDHAQSFSMTGSNVSLQGQVCYEIELISLIVPNARLQNIGKQWTSCLLPIPIRVSIVSRIIGRNWSSYHHVQQPSFQQYAVYRSHRRR